MKRVVLFALSVALFASVASAQTVPGTAEVWIQPVGGGNQIDILESETAIIQLWMNYTAPADGEERLMLGMDAQLDHRDAQGINFEVVGFNTQGPWGINGTFFTKSRGQLDEAPFDDVPDYTGVGNLDWYQYQGTVTPPYSNQTGLPPNLGAILLDEIIIHGVTDSGTISNRVIFATGLKAPSWFEGTFYEGVASPLEYPFNLGTGINKANPVYVHVSVPEPASLALLAFGGLAAIRRRR
jgi:hypothetical protein